MKTLQHLCIAFVVLITTSTFAQSIVKESLTLNSKILNKDKTFSIYLPPSYETSERYYPVVYLLHGNGGKDTDWIQYGNMQVQLDKAIQDEKIPEVIVVMPDAEITYYMNNIKGEYQYEDYFIKELLPHIEKNYRCRTEKQFRSVSGLSMGGYGALLYAMHYPDLFGACAAFSPAVFTDEEIVNMSTGGFNQRYTTALGTDYIKNTDRITDFYHQNSIIYLAEHMPETQKNAVKFYIDCGDDDHLYTGNSTLHIMMRSKKIPHEYRVRDGAHNWIYWRDGLIDGLSFVTKDFIATAITE